MFYGVLNDDVKELFISDMANISEDLTDYKFSLKYRIKRRHIINKYLKSIYRPKENLHYRVKLAFVVSMIFIALLIAGFVTYKIISGFYINEYKDHAMIRIADRSQECMFIEEKIYFDMDLSGYEVEVVADTPYCYCVNLKSEGISICALQYPLARFGVMRNDIEDGLVDIKEMRLTGTNGLFHQTRNEENHLYIKRGNYIIVITGNYNEDTINKLVKFTKLK